MTKGLATRDDHSDARLTISNLAIFDTYSVLRSGLLRYSCSGGGSRKKLGGGSSLSQ